MTEFEKLYYDHHKKELLAVAGRFNLLHVPGLVVQGDIEAFIDLVAIKLSRLDAECDDLHEQLTFGATDV